MNRGYIKLWRKSLESPTWDNPNVWRLWCWCLMKAAHKQVKLLIGFKELILEPGQLIFGRKKCAIETGISEQTVRTCLQALKSTSNITIKSTNRFSIISIINWDSYQVNEYEINQQKDQQITNNQPATNQQLTTNNNVKNVKNIIGPAKQRRQLPEDFSLSENLTAFAAKLGLNSNRVNEVFAQFTDYHRSRGTRMLDWTAAWRTWVRNERKFQKQPFQKSVESASYTPPDRIQKLLQQAQDREKYLRGER